MRWLVPRHYCCKNTEMGRSGALTSETLWVVNEVRSERSEVREVRSEKWEVSAWSSLISACERSKDEPSTSLSKNNVPRTQQLHYESTPLKRLHFSKFFCFCFSEWLLVVDLFFNKTIGTMPCLTGFVFGTLVLGCAFAQSDPSFDHQKNTYTVCINILPGPIRFRCWCFVLHLVLGISRTAVDYRRVDYVDAVL